jgi:hypothetical protein
MKKHINQAKKKKPLLVSGFLSSLKILISKYLRRIKKRKFFFEITCKISPDFVIISGTQILGDIFDYKTVR